MKLIIDSNKLQSVELSAFLDRSQSNFAVLTDFVAMEAYKGNTLVGIYRSLEILSKYPEQVIVLKSSVSAYKSSGRKKGLQKRLIDRGQTKQFSKYIRSLHSARNGDRRIQRSILKHGCEADSHLAKMESIAKDLKPTIDILGKQYTKAERSVIRNGEKYNSNMIKKVMVSVLDMASDVVIDSPYISSMPSIQELPNTYFFRHILAIYFLVLKRTAAGGILEMAPSKIRNDFVDMAIVAYSTFFDGLLSDDARATEIFEQSRCFLYCIGAEVPSMSGQNGK